MSTGLYFFLIVLAVVFLLMPLAVFLLSYMQMSGWLIAAMNNVIKIVETYNKQTNNNGGSDES